MRTGVFLPNWIGDVAMATPALGSLRKLVDAEGGELIAIMKPYVGEVLDGLGWFDEAIPLRKKKDKTRSTNVQQLRDARLDRVLLLTNSFSTAMLAFRSGAKRRIGYGGQFRRLLLNQIVRPLSSSEVIPPVDSYRHLAEAIGAEPVPPTLQLATTSDDEADADAVWQQLGLPEKRVVVLNSGGAFGAAKSWPAEHFANLAKRITDETDQHVLVNCGPAERDIARQIASDSNSDRVHSLADWPTAEAFKVPIGLSKAVIRRSSLLLTTDSGPRFFGIAFGKPVVTLFGPTGFAATDVHYEQETPLSLDLDCQPCMKAVCPLGHHRCMNDLSVERVFNAVRAGLRSAGRSTEAA